ncbi:MAG: glycogen/starch/alpha-glucan phosphorylase [Clostridia bacterium]|nr:glycogen/starch/alpha-glucan phosphorylase [Clostridia bacterium]
MNEFEKNTDNCLLNEFGVSRQNATTHQLYRAISKTAFATIQSEWKKPKNKKTVCYFSAEFLIGRMITSNLLNTGLLDECEKYLNSVGKSIKIFENIEDAALGNGGLGRLAACFLDSAATIGYALNGYGIRYRYGLFKQSFVDGWQNETADDWLAASDPWSIRREDEKVLVKFGAQSVYAVPYDMPVIGYFPGNDKAAINTLRLWQSEPVNAFDFTAFNEQRYSDAVSEKNRAEAISAVLYPNDEGYEGKCLRLKQQYFFASASLVSILKEYKNKFSNDFSHFSEQYAIQLNDTHPTVAIPELLRLLTEQENLGFDEAFEICKNTFAYTNHTIMAEALEKWDVKLFNSVLPEVYPYVVMINLKLKRDLAAMGICGNEQNQYLILENNLVHMARMAIYATHSTNGVAQIHTEILKEKALSNWHKLYPGRFKNETNGITQRRWLKLCNPELSAFITEKTGEGWTVNLDEIKKLEKYKDDPDVLNKFNEIKLEKKKQLAEFILKKEGIKIDPTFMFDIQIKRLHEYKRQLLNAFSILDIYYGILDGRITDFTPTVFIFGAKAAPGYRRAKAIIKYINEIAKLINSDERVTDKLKVVFVQNYNVSYAEKLIPAADVSEQISTAGTEASGTGNMKFMLNGAVTLGTYDGANIEIVEQAGEENNYIFGAEVEDIEKIKYTYSPKKLYDENPRIRAVLDSLINGTLQDNASGCFRELYDAILYGTSWHKADHYFILHDFMSYADAKLKVNKDYKNKSEFSKKCLLNVANAGKFSSDRTIKGYAEDIWKI